MGASSRLMITEAERRFPVRIKVAVPLGGFGRRLTEMYAWLDATCGADGWTSTPAGLRGVVNDAVAFYFTDVRLAGAFVARWCAGGHPQIAGGTFTMREDDPAARIGGKPHSTRLGG
jgi:hypothetical protein